MIIKSKAKENLVIGFYPNSQQAYETLRRLRGGRFFRSVAVSISADGKQTVKGHSQFVLLFSGLLTAAFMVLPILVVDYSWSTTILLAGVACFAGISLGPRVGFSFSGRLLQGYAAKVLPGEAMVLVQCKPFQTKHIGDLMLENEAAKPVTFVVRPYLPEPHMDGRPDRELLSAGQLRQYAISWAEEHRPAAPLKSTGSILDSLTRWEQTIESVRRDLGEAVELDQSITPASEWLLDNAYIIQNHIHDVRRNLPQNYREILPSVKTGANGINLRVLSLATELANKTDGSIKTSAIYNFLSSYQGTYPLTIAELWTFPLMVRFALIEDLAHQSLRVSRRQHDRERADFWANRLLSAAHLSPERIPMIFSEISAQNPSLPPHFVIRLIDQLSEEETVFAAAQQWFESKLQCPLQDLIRNEHAQQSQKQVSIANDVTSLRRLAQLDWQDIFESISVVEAVLEQDEVYSRSDFATRDRCRKAVEEIALYSKRPEIEIAKNAVQISAQKGSDREGNVAYFLIDKGRKNFEALFGCRLPLSKRLVERALDHPGLVYFTAVFSLTAAVLGFGLWMAGRSGAGPWALLGFGIAAILPASEVSIQLVNYWITLFIPPRLIPRMCFKSGIPDEFRTIVVVPTMLVTPQSIRDDLNKLEMRYLANPDSNLLYSLLTDWRDATSPNMPEDQPLFETAVDGITALNEKYGEGHFFLFHRDRTWSATQKCWIGWERKRGKLEDLNRFLMNDSRENARDFLKAGDNEFLKGIRFVITLDSDTELPHDAALHMVEAMAHPLNRPVLCSNRRVICEGYGIIQPRVVASLPSAKASYFSSIFSSAKGTDPYSQAISDLYQDLFGEGIYMGKAIYDLRAFHQVLSGRFPEDTLLSHDLIEGNYLRVGCDSTILLFEQFPQNYHSFTHRQHRWIRGDWQIFDWILPRTPVGDGQNERNPLSVIGRWKIFDNLRRSLVAPACILVLLGSWLIMPNSAFWNIFIAFAILVPAITPLPARVREEIIKGRLFIWQEQATELLRTLITAVLLPCQAWASIDAIVRVWFRRSVTGFNLLQWETAQAVHWKSLKSNADLKYRTLIICVVSALFIPALWYRGFTVWAAAIPYLVLWMLSPAVSSWINQSRSAKIKRELTQGERLYVRQVARETWRYFEDLVGPQSNWLPPDNSQESLRVEVAYRTSPTNIGLFLLSKMAAHDFGYITLDQLVTQLNASLDSIDRLEKYRGHLLNWYDIKTLEPLKPSYVSTVDSGNFLASLWTLDQGLKELNSQPIVGPGSLEGLADALSVFDAHCARIALLPASLKTTISSLAVLCREKTSGLKDSLDRIQSVGEICESAFAGLLNENASWIKETDAGEIRYWTGKVQDAIQNWRSITDRYYSWAPLLFNAPGTVPLSLKQIDLESISLATLAGAETDPLAKLEQELEKNSGDNPQWLAGIHEEISNARVRARETQREIQSLLDRSGRLQEEMGLSFLYDEDRKLFAIGHDVSEGPQTISHYDLLASEARLTSLIAIARGEVPPAHWNALGRPFSMNAGRKLLLSWSGSMFEYMMPVLFTKLFESSLLDRACREAIEIQIEYGRSRKVPWGISESAFSALDAHQIYQYRAFGVPALGLKRGLGDDLVIAPYSTVLALMIDLPGAVDNMKQLELEGLHGNKGFYESIDYSRERQEGKRGEIVYAYMAHHQGMSFLAMANALKDQVMQKRFHSDLRVRSAELLLYEGVPPSRSVSYLTNMEDRPPARLIVPPIESIQGRISNEKTPVPKTQLFSNGSYSLMITNSGGGYSHWRDQDITRWRADTTRDNWGSYCYLRDLDSSEFWSTTYHPTGKTGTNYSVVYHSNRVEFRCGYRGIEATTEVTVSPEEDVEVRRIQLFNRSNRERRLDLTTYMELAMAHHAADRAHPAFSKMFIHTEALPEKSALLAFRRPNDGKEPKIWAGHLLAPAAGKRIQFETGRMRFLGRSRSLEFPAAMASDLSNLSGPVLDPVLSIRREVLLGPGEKAILAVITLAADSRNRAIQLIEKYGDLETVDRAFKLAWTHSQLSFRFLRIQHEAAQRYQELAGRMLYPSAGLRPGPERLRRNTLGQSRLWAFGISGDLPICAVVISDPLDLGTVRDALQAHTFWNSRGLKSDLVILNGESGGYEQPLQQRLLRMIQVYSIHTGIDTPGGVFVRSVEQISGDDYTLLLSVANVVLLASRGPIGRQLIGIPEAASYPPELRTRASERDEAGQYLPMPPLVFFNGLGGFNSDGREYVIHLSGGSRTPAPWINVLANSDFGTLVDETGQGCTWNINSQLNRLTPWHNDSVSPDTSGGIYIRDEETGRFWTPSAAPVRETAPYRIHHGQGYTRILHNSHGIEQELTIFVPVDDMAPDPLRIQKLQLRNSSQRKRRLTVTFYSEWVLGRDREETQLHITTNWDPVSGMLLARNAYNSEFADYIAFAAATPGATGYSADRMEFIGRNRSAANPAALERKSLSGRTGAGLDPCAALQVKIELNAGEKAEVAFILGQARTMQDVRTLLDQYSKLQQVDAALSKTKAWWDQLLGAVQVATPDKAADFLLNRWLLYQTLSCRIWGRSALYQSGGAFGFRDQLQDVMALVYTKPALARKHILRAAGRQFLEGDVQHWWHPQSGAGVRTRCSDDLLWLPYVTAHYVQITGDKAILDDRIPYLEGQPIRDNELEVYSTPSTSMTDGTLFEHCCKAIDKGSTEGEHGLPLIGLCDWNDGFNRVGIQGKGESVWLAWFLIEVLKSFGEICLSRNERELADLCARRARDFRSAVQKNGWDGEWYRRAFFDDGSPLGSRLNEECRIDSLAQSWAAISGGAPREAIDQSLRSVEKNLVRDGDKLVLLFAPPFRNSEPNPGYVAAYPPGVRENGGQYTHAALWVALAYLRRGNGNRAVELLQMLNPIELTRSPADVGRYRCEPYVLAGDVYSLEGNVGRGGWTWYTGSSSWMYRIWIEEVLGFKLRGNELTLNPTIPADWPGFRIMYRFGNSVYDIRVENPERSGHGVVQMELDGAPLSKFPIPLHDDGLEHFVRIRLGAELRIADDE
jgi:cyclic beta-1,2-glucan synthetase